MTGSPVAGLRVKATPVRLVIQVAENHGLHIYRRAQIVGNAVDLPVDGGAGVMPLIEDRLDRQEKLFPGIKGKFGPRFAAHHFKKLFHYLRQVLGLQLGIGAHIPRIALFCKNILKMV